MQMIKAFIKKALITSAIWCILMNTIGLIGFITGFRDPGGYVRPINPFFLSVATYPFFLLATTIHLVILHKNRKLNKWPSAFTGVLCVYILVIIPLILDDDYFEYLDWWVPVFLIAQTAFLIFSDFVTKRWVPNSKEV